MQPVIAVIDIGTNSTLMLIATCEAGKIMPFEQWSETTRLGRDMLRTHLIGDRGFHDTLKAIQDFQKTAQKFTKHIFAIGTQVFRSTKNRDEIVSRIQNKTGLSIEVLTEKQEAVYGFQGVLTGIEAGEILVIDIGGGSTELIRGDRSSNSAVSSIPIGAVVLTEQFFFHDPPVLSERRALKAAVETTISTTWKHHLQTPIPWICIGGTSTLDQAKGLGASVVSQSSTAK